MKKIIYSLLFILPVCVNAQLVLNDGARITTEQGAVVTIDGDIENNQGNILNDGLYRVNGFYQNNDASLTQGNGEYRILGNWINDGSFTPGTSHVRLDGANQDITGDTVTTFFDLSLETSGIKSLQISSEVIGTLNLNDLELATLNDTMFVLNNVPAAIQYDNTFTNEGFVSGNLTGRLFRATSNGNYIFPVGNSAPSYRFRPIDISSSAASGYFVNFRNVDPITDGLTQLSDSLCSINPNFYHIIGNATSSAANVSVNYLAADGTFTTNANHNSQWNGVTSTSGTNGNFITMNSIGYSGFSNEPFVLATNSPISEISGDSSICEGSQGTFTGTGNPNWIYTWSTDNGNVINNGDQQVNIDFTSSQNSYVALTVTDPISGCSYQVSDSLFLVVGNLPDTSISFTSGLILPGQIIDVANGGTNVNTWNWSYDNYSSNNQSFQHFYTDSGSYTITLTVISPEGCVGMNEIEITVNGNVIIPNVFTPNGDGFNGLFRPTGFTVYELSIFNRWGQLLYQGDQSSRGWDGRTAAGTDVPEGTYLFILKVPNIEDITGNLMLIR